MKRLAVVVALTVCVIPNTIDTAYLEGSSGYYAYLAVYRLADLARIIEQLEQSSLRHDQKKLKKINKVMKTPEFKEYRKSHLHLTICNPGLEILKVSYLKIADYKKLTKRSLRKQIVKPGATTQIIVPKDELLQCQQQVPCLEQCDQIGEHYHWGKKITIQYEDSELICLDHFLQSSQ